MQPFFSIITVTLNPGEDLGRTVQSCLTQTFEDFEVVIKDCCSSDSSISVVPDDRRIRKVIELDEGIYDGMNQAIRYSRGRFVHVLNAGDLFADNGVLSDVAAAIKSHPGVPYFYGDVIKPRSRSGYIFYPDKLSRYFLYTRPICHQSWLLSRDVYLSYKLDHDIVASADHDLLLRMIIRDQMKYHHIKRLVTIYKGGGFSELITERKDQGVLWRERKGKYFSRGECAVFDCAFAFRNIMKAVFYDRFLYWIVRPFLRFRARS